MHLFGILLLIVFSVATKSVEISFFSDAPSGTFEITGTLELPDTELFPKPFPAVVLISGSGPGQQDETIQYTVPTFQIVPPPAEISGCGVGSFQVSVFVQLSESLVSQGFAVLRYNKRSCVKESGVSGCTYDLCNISDPDPPPFCLDLHKLTGSDFATDAANAVLYLREEWLDTIDPNSISLLGHSEGCMVAPYAAQLVGGVKSVVQLMGIGVPLDFVMTQQYVIAIQKFEFGYRICQNTDGDTGVSNWMNQNLQVCEILLQQCKDIFPAIENGSIPDEQLVNVGGLSSAGFWRGFTKWGQPDELFQILSHVTTNARLLTINSLADIQVFPQFYQPLHSVVMSLPNTKIKLFPNLTHILTPADFSSDRISEELVNVVVEFLKENKTNSFDTHQAESFYTKISK